jgi:hypothetical protein
MNATGTEAPAQELFCRGKALASRWGWLPELMPEARGRGLASHETNAAPAWADNLIGVYRLGGNTAENVTAIR